MGALNFQETSRQNRAVLELQRRGQVTERFTKAIEQLGQQGLEKLDVRIGAVYALEQIARDSAELHWPIMEVLTAYLREHASVTSGLAPGQPAAEAGRSVGTTPGLSDASRRRLPADHQAIATVIGRRSREQDPDGQHLDLHRADLSQVLWRKAHLEGAYLSGAHLEGAYLSGAHLEGAYLSGAHLEGANLSDAYLEGAVLSFAHLEEAYLIATHMEEAVLIGAHLEGAVLEGADLERTNFSFAHLEGAYLIDAHLEGANLSLAHLEGADLSDAHLEGANLTMAHLKRANLSGANLLRTTGLTAAQLQSVVSCEGAGLAAEFTASGTEAHEEEHSPSPD